METPVNHWEYNNLKELVDSEIKRLEGEDKRLSKRIEEIENTTREINSINITLQKQADNISQISGNLAQMIKKQDEESERIKALESKDGERWKSTTKSAVQIIIGLISGLLLAWMKNMLGL